MTDLVSQFKQIMDGYLQDVQDATDEATTEVGEKTAQFLKDNSGIRRHRKRKSYVKGFKVTIDRKGLTTKAVVHNTEYRLTHLLENGHAIKNGTGRTYGKTKPIPHWSKAQDYAKKEFEKLIVEKINAKRG